MVRSRRSPSIRRRRRQWHAVRTLSLRCLSRSADREENGKASFRTRHSSCEHDGFFDHVPPGSAADDNPAEFGRYGVRVPAMSVGPWVEPGACHHGTFDPTSLIKCKRHDLIQRSTSDQLSFTGRDRPSVVAAGAHWLTALGFRRDCSRCRRRIELALSSRFSPFARLRSGRSRPV